MTYSIFSASNARDFRFLKEFWCWDSRHPDAAQIKTKLMKRVLSFWRSSYVEFGDVDVLDIWKFCSVPPNHIRRVNVGVTLDVNRSLHNIKPSCFALTVLKGLWNWALTTNLREERFFLQREDLPIIQRFHNQAPEERWNLFGIKIIILWEKEKRNLFGIKIVLGKLYCVVAEG